MPQATRQSTAIPLACKSHLFSLSSSSSLKISKHLAYTKLHTLAQLLAIGPLYLINIPYKLNLFCVLVSHVTCFSLRFSKMSTYPDKLHS